MVLYVLGDESFKSALSVKNKNKISILMNLNCYINYYFCLKKYLNNFAYKNVVQNNLWDAFYEVNISILKFKPLDK